MVDGGASIRILNLPLFPILADHFLKCSKFTPNNIDRKILTVANKVEFPHLFNLFLTLHTSIHGCTCTLVVPVANINYNILGTPFFKTYVKPVKIDNMSLTVIIPHEFSVNTLPCTAHKEKGYPYFFYIYTNEVIENFILKAALLKLFIFQFHVLFL